jgi:hypothetical protein
MTTIDQYFHAYEVGDRTTIEPLLIKCGGSSAPPRASVVGREKEQSLLTRMYGLAVRRK